jgi:cell fate regulator YaaT (PSP1 superfamily)
MKWEEPYSSGSGTWHKKNITFGTMKGTAIFIHCHMKISTGAEKLQPKLCEMIGGRQTNIYCQGTISEMRPCSNTELCVNKVRNQAQPVKYSGGEKKKVVFDPNL